jgi:DNA-binding PadR family transcriptional regulator
MPMNGGIAELGRLAEPALVILLALGDGPKHGYAIMADAEGLSGTRMGPGTLYAAIARLEARGLIEALPADDRRRPYRLTGLGESALRTHLDALDQLVQAGQRRLDGLPDVSPGP